MVITNDWRIEPAFGAACNLILNQVPIMYAAVDCDLDNPGCQWASAFGGEHVWYEGPPGRHSVHIRCCIADGTQCFPRDRQCRMPDGQVYPCTCGETRGDVHIRQCSELVFSGCQP